MKLSNNQQIFLELVKAGLWEKDACLLPYGDIDFQEVYKLAQEQAVVGLVAAGLEHVKDTKIPQELALTIASEALQLEHRNISMNNFIGVLVEKLRQADIYTLLVKGQGVAQCYERPLWRASGDIDLFLSESNYYKAKAYLTPLASNIHEEDIKRLHLSMTIDSWEVELHGTLHGDLTRSIDKTIDKVQEDVFYGGAVRSWINGNTQIFLPRADEDIVIVFAHILQHLFKSGIGLRQICDWCRLLWTFRSSINILLLKKRLHKMGVMSEWETLACLSIEWLGMPADTMPFYSPDTKWNYKAKEVLDYIFYTGNFGHNRDYSYYTKYPYLIYKTISLWRHTKDSYRFIKVFPIDTVKVWWRMIMVGVKEVLKK